MKTLAWIAGIAALLYGLHRLALWMEERGWIYYARKRASPRALGNALLELQQLAEPGARQVLEARRGERAEHDGQGET